MCRAHSEGSPFVTACAGSHPYRMVSFLKGSRLLAVHVTPPHIALHSPLLSRITCARRERVVAGGRAALGAGDEGQGRAGHGGTRGGRGRAPRGHREPQGRDAGLGTVCVAGRCEAVGVCDTTRVRKASVGAREGRALRACRARAWRRPLRTRRPRAPSPCPLHIVPASAQKKCAHVSLGWGACWRRARRWR